MKVLRGFLIAAVILAITAACMSDGVVFIPSVSSSAPTAQPPSTTIATTTTATTVTTTEHTTTTTTNSTLTHNNGAILPNVTVGNVPFIDQTIDYPTGCESVSTVMVLQYWGYDISVDTFIDSYLPCGDLPRKRGNVRIGCDPNVAFPGNPRTTKGYGCFAPVITASVQNIMREQHRVINLTGMSLPELCRTYIDNGIPVILWATAGMQKPYPSTVWQTPEGKTIEWISPNHCLVLTGYSDTHYFFNDPQKGIDVPYKRAACELAFNTLGKQAVVIDQKPTPTTTTLTPLTTTLTIPLPSETAPTTHFSTTQLQ